MNLSNPTSHETINKLYALPVLNRYLVYSPFHSVVALANKASIDQLRRGSSIRATGESAGAETGDAKDDREGFDPEFLGLITTRKCNLNCAYCGFDPTGANDGAMNIDMAVAAVDWMFDHKSQMGKQDLNIQFFGGEPTLAWDVIEVVVHHARMKAAASGVIPYFEITTNGAFGARKAAFLGDYMDAVTLSFDGPREIHDKQRSRSSGLGSFSSTSRAASALSESGVELCFRCCIAQESVARMQEITEWFCSRYKPSVINFETVRRTPRSDLIGLLPPDPFEFAINFEYSRRVAAEYGVRQVYASDLQDSPRRSFCPVGNNALILSPDGLVSACYLPAQDWKERGLDLTFGKYQPASKIMLDMEAARRIKNLADNCARCESCFCRSSCAGGCVVHNSFPGASGDYNDFCIQTRIVTACSLLRELDQTELIDSFLSQPDELRKLAFQPREEESLALQ